MKNNQQSVLLSQRLLNFFTYPKKVITLGFLLLLVLFVSILFNKSFFHPSTVYAENCTISSILVNPCRPWLGAYATGYSNIANGATGQVQAEEQRTGAKLDVIHTGYHQGASGDTLTSEEVFFAKQPNQYIFVNWWPTRTWTEGNGSNAAVNKVIDTMAASIKQVAPNKIFLTVQHEPNDKVASDPGDPNNCTKFSGKGAVGNTPALYRAMWANVESRFKADGVTNVVWALLYEGYEPLNCLDQALYPGNNLIDWIGFDSYDSTGDTGQPGSATAPFEDTAGRLYNYLEQLSNEKGTLTYGMMSKPVVVGEWGACRAGLSQTQKDDYYADAKYSLDHNLYPDIKLYMIFDAPGTGNKAPGGCQLSYTNSGSPDPQTLDAYKAFADDPIFSGSTSVPTTAPTIAPKTTPTPTPTITSSTTKMNVTVLLDGIGKSGDNTNPNESSLSNKNPQQSTITADFSIYTTNNQEIAAGSGTLTYNATSGGYTGSVPISSGFPTGQYTIKIKTNSHLQKEISGIQAITADKTNTITPVALVAGDINNDNQLNILDYNLLLGCYSDLLPATNCPTATAKQAADLNDDGNVNQVDYNLFIRELSTQPGQ